jgi:shikimate 5-dehydrogenase
MENKEASTMTNTKVAKMTRAERIKALSVPSELRTIKVEMKAEGGRVVYVSTPQRARIMETADRIMRRAEIANS